MFIGAAGRTPRGIDRVDMGYATHIFAASPMNLGLVPSLSHMGVVAGADAARMAARVERHWRENQIPASDPELDRLCVRMQGRVTGTSREIKKKKSPLFATVSRYAAMCADARWSLWRSAASAVPQGAIYINTGQALLGFSWFFDWLGQRPDIKPVFMLHDLIPILFPEYSGVFLSKHHARAVATAARYAAGVVATSAASAEEIRAAVARLGRRDLPIHVVPLPVSDIFFADAKALSDAFQPIGSPYFVTVGILDQRKNHVMLLQAWREMLRNGDPVPKLIIAGSRGLRVNGLIDLLYRTPGLADHVIEANGLSTPAMRELIKGARALLMPSFTEGFGLPVIEALALRTPVIASDIPAHREVGGSYCTYLDPLDGLGWKREILARTREDESALYARRQTLAGYKWQNWKTYFDEVMPFLQSL